jgi:hypothetical protein
MATANSTRQLASSSLSAHFGEFAAIQRRLLISINHIQLASQHFADLTSLGVDDQAAGLTVHEAAKALDGIYSDLDTWWVRRPQPELIPNAATSPEGDEQSEPLPRVDPSDKTADRICAFLASVRGMSGFDVEGEEGVRRGRAIIQRMAIAATGEEDPNIELTPSHCADVLQFLRVIEPVSPTDWWQDPVDAPSHLAGFSFVLAALENNLRALAQSSADSTDSDLDESGADVREASLFLKQAVEEQQRRVHRLRSLIECFGEAIETGQCADSLAATGGLLDLADSIHLALDHTVLIQRAQELAREEERGS